MSAPMSMPATQFFPNRAPPTRGDRITNKPGRIISRIAAFVLIACFARALVVLTALLAVLTVLTLVAVLAGIAVVTLLSAVLKISTAFALIRSVENTEVTARVVLVQKRFSQTVAL